VAEGEDVVDGGEVDMDVHGRDCMSGRVEAG
jgi:hypothetical protein